MDFSQKTYLVLEVPPAPWVEQVQSFRQKYEPWRRSLPVEITIVGSSGVGVFLPEQPAQEAFEKIDKLTRNLDPISVNFFRKTCFPKTNLFFFEPADPSDLIQLQKSIVETGLKFGNSPYPFTPHCTIADLGSSPTPSALTELEAIVLPKGRILFEAISFYQLTAGLCTLLHRSYFGKA